MGKIRVKTLGDEELEKEEKKKAQKRAEVKKAEKAEVKVEGKPESEETVEAQRVEPEKVSKGEQKKAKKEKFLTKKKQTRSDKYMTVAKLVDKNKIYSLNDALSLLPQLKVAKFDETVELHINTTETGISGNLVLPHGTGKQLRVVIADDAIIANVEKGKIDFDVLLATPQMMPRLAKVARILGPKGLMPNPKNGTIAPQPEEAIKKFEAGQISFKTESKTPIIHMAVGKVSFGDKKLQENIKTAISAIPAAKLRKITLKSTMSPGIKIDFSKLD